MVEKTNESTTHGMAPRRSALRRLAGKLAFLALWLLFGFVALTLQDARLRQVELNPPYIDKMYMPQTEYAKVLAFGYDMAMADILYIRAIQAYGAQFSLAKKNYEAVFHFFDTIVTLDPKFIQAYEFGSLVMSEGGHSDLAIGLNEKGWLADSTEYRLPFLNAYTAHWTMHDPLKGKMWAMRAIRARNCPDWVNRFLAYFDRESGRYEAAFEYHLRSYLTNVGELGHAVELQISRNQVEKIAEQWHIDVLNRAMGQYLENHDNQLPENLAAAAKAGALNGFVTMDYPAAVKFLDEEALAQRLEEKRKTQPKAKYIDLIEDGLKICVHEISTVPVGPPDFAKRPTAYVLRHDVASADYVTAVQKKTLVVTQADAADFTNRLLNGTLRPALRAWLNEKGSYPEKLEEAFPEGKCPVEPVGGHWYYDQETGNVWSPALPEL